MLPFLSIIGIFLSIILLLFNFRNNRSNVYLALFFFSISAYSLIQYVLLYSTSETILGIVFINIGFITYMVGPMIYLYTRSVLTDNSRLRKKDILHFLPMIIFVLNALPHIFSSWTHKTGVANEIILDRMKIIQFNDELFHGVIPNLFIFLSRPILVLFYLTLSIILFARFLKTKKMNMVFSHQTFMTKWLTVLFAFMMVISLSHSAKMIVSHSDQNLNEYSSLDALQWISGIGLAGLLISPFLFPSILYGLPRFQKTEKSENKSFAVEIKTDSDHVPLIEQEPTTNSTPEYETEYLDKIEKVTDECMKEMQPYLHSECNMAYFAKMVKIPAHHLAYLFKEVKQQPFNDYRNAWRVKHAKELIRQGKTGEYTFEAIGMLSGFSSKNTFFTAFKKIEGITPGAYAEQINS